MTLTEWGLAAAFTAWWGICLAGQFNVRLIVRARPRDVLHLIANWRFFAPVPSRRDYHLEFRSCEDDGQGARWRRLSFVSPRSTASAFWNPRKRERKAFNTLVRRLCRVRDAYGREPASRSVAYLHLLTLADRACARDPSERIQFRVIATQDHAPASRLGLVYLSDWHSRRI